MSSNRMYMFSTLCMPTESACFNAVTKDSAHLWHCRYEHLGFKGLKTFNRGDGEWVTTTYVSIKVMQRLCHRKTAMRSFSKEKHLESNTNSSSAEFGTFYRKGRED